ncbi:MAG: amidohydrolase family protein [Candidatus Tectomicrobia bacterium]|uniref:Amidohydrolase family protein n=1 Tax=Tectimicrobiota bacterium TaxID=2528274 RepID=A0A937W474_UNCTE|nr:amidohydrolase family protein [Candidatus Tectomicrobia bacterium]
MTTVFTHTTIVTADPGRTVLHDTALAVDGNTIAAIGATEDLRRAYPQADVYDGRGKALFPGLINCHAHLTATLNRGITEDFGFPPNLHLPVSAQSLLSAEELTVMALLGALESLKSGTTTLVENAQGIATYAAALAQTGLRWVWAESARDAVVPPDWRPGEDVQTFSAPLREAALQRLHDLFTTWHGAHDGLIAVFPAAALTEASSPELLRAIRAFAEQHDLGYTIHLAQSRLEVESMMRLRGVRPTFFLYAHDFLSPRLFAAHCRYVDAAEIALLGNTRTIVTHQAGMAARRAVIPPIPALRAAGCPIAMGTDNNSQDMLEVMRAGLLTERILRDDSTQPQPEDVLQETTRGGAYALCQPADIGSLEVGKKADLLVLNTQQAHLVPTLRIVSSWLHNGQAGDIEAVMVNGRFLMRDRRVLTMDETHIVQEAERIGRRAWNQLLARYPSAPFPTRVAPPLS